MGLNKLELLLRKLNMKDLPKLKNQRELQRRKLINLRLKDLQKKRLRLKKSKKKKNKLNNFYNSKRQRNLPKKSYCLRKRLKCNHSQSKKKSKKNKNKKGRFVRNSNKRKVNLKNLLLKRLPMSKQMHKKY